MPVILGDGCHDATKMPHDVPLGDSELEIMIGPQYLQHWHDAPIFSHCEFTHPALLMQVMHQRTTTRSSYKQSHALRLLRKP